MTDKQIIIDGVDVSGCEWYSSTYFKPCDGCKNTPNCYYKQLKAKEQECEELKKECEIWKNQVLTIDDEAITVQITQQQFEQYNQLKEKNEKMSKGYSKLTEIVSPYIDDFTGYNEELGGFDLILCVKELLEQLDELKRQHEGDKGLITSTGKMNYQLMQEYDKLKTTLTEIKEITETKQKQSVFVGETVFEQILQKISEVIQDES